MSYSKTLSQLSKESKIFFLLNFTRELIKHSTSGEVSELDKVLKHEEKEQKNLEGVKEKTKKKILKERRQRFEDLFGGSFEEEYFKKQEPDLMPPVKFSSAVPRPPQKFFSEIPKLPQKQTIKYSSPRVLRIPEPRLPPGLQYLKPTPTRIDIDLGKINPLIKDFAVKIIECNGPEQNIIVKGAMGSKPTSIILSREEIEDIINKFSTTAKIPLQEGVSRIVAGNLILSAIVSDVVGSRFIIQKMLLPAQTFGRF